MVIFSRHMIMLGGSLTRYRTPVLASQKGDGWLRNVVSKAGNVVMQPVRAAGGAVRNKARATKRKLIASAAEAASDLADEMSQRVYKKAKSRLNDVFGEV